MTLPVVFTANGPSGYNLTNSLRFRSSVSAYLNRTPASAGNRKTWTWSGWVKRGTLGVSQYFFSGGTGGSDTTQFGINFLADNKLNWLGGSGTQYRTTTQVFRDPSAWYHIVLAFDTTLATANDRIKIYVNGTQITAFDNLTNPTQNVDYGINQAEAHNIGRWTGASGYFDGYMTEINFIDGQALTPSSFGETSTTTGVWIPKKYTGTYGTNGFYLPFTDTTSTSTLGTDFSGNSNTWTVNNISLTSGSTYDSMTDVPTLTSATVANYAVMNPLDAQGTATLTDANLTLASSSTTHRNRKATFVVPSTGKWYWELTTASTSSSSVILGWGLQTTTAATDSQAGNANTWMAQNDANQDIFNQTTTVLSTGSAVAGGSIRQVAYDSGTGKLWFGVNNTWYSSTDLTSGNPSAGTNECMTLSAGSYFPTITCYNLTANVNFGQQPFAYTPPTGFVALNTFNLPTPTIGVTASSQANKYMDATTFDGVTGGGTVTNSGSMQPDFVWMKVRNNANNHELADSVRGTPYASFSNLTNAEVSDTRVSAFNSNGFSYGTNSNSAITGRTVVGWQWRASNATAVTNTAGSITSTVSANTTAGFSVVTWTGTNSNATVGHGLGVAPSMIILKPRNASDNWPVWHSSFAVNEYVYLNLTNAKTSLSTFMNSTLPSSTVISLGTWANVNTNTQTMVAYCFTPIAGYSAFGSYTGNGSSTDGPFVYLGFRPRFVMVKRTDSTGNWSITDTAINPYNNTTGALRPNTADSESTVGTVYVQPLSNGFKITNNNTDTNASSGTYIYACFAENPFKYANAR